jgi:hypothetical protein
LQLALSEEVNIKMSADARRIEREAPESLADESQLDARGIKREAPEESVDGSETDVAPKRQRPDGTTEIITLDDQYDLTLIVGKSHEDGIKNFRVNRGSLRLASAPFKAMLGGSFAESEQPEVEFPDDFWKPFHTFLLVTHMKYHDLPESMGADALYDLAQFCDKYDLGSLMSTFVVAKKWLTAHKRGGSWELGLFTVECVFAAHVFKMDADFAILADLLAMHIKLLRDGSIFYSHADGEVFENGDHSEPGSQWKELPVGISGKYSRELSGM